MSTFSAILAAIGALGTIAALISQVIRLFKKPKETKIEDGARKIDEELDEFKKDGRPHP